MPTDLTSFGYICIGDLNTVQIKPRYILVFYFENNSNLHQMPRGPTFLLLTVVLLRVLWFLPTIPMLGRGMPPMTWQ